MGEICRSLSLDSKILVQETQGECQGLVEEEAIFHLPSEYPTHQDAEQTPICMIIHFFLDKKIFEKGGKFPKRIVPQEHHCRWTRTQIQSFQLLSANCERDLPILQFKGDICSWILCPKTESFSIGALKITSRGFGIFLILISSFPSCESQVNFHNLSKLFARRSPHPNPQKTSKTKRLPFLKATRKDVL